MTEGHIITVESDILYLDDNSKDAITLTVAGTFGQKNGKYYISYQESELTGYSGYTTIISATPQRVSMTRSMGTRATKLLIEPDVIHTCLYDTPVGVSELSAEGINIECSLSENGGRLKFRYILSVGDTKLSQNSITITIREK